jgi:hypothetical protein
MGFRWPVIYMSGNDDAAVREAALASGCIAFQTKPFSAQELMEPLKRAVTCSNAPVSLPRALRAYRLNLWPIKFRILRSTFCRDPYRTLLFHVSDDLRRRIYGRYRYQHVNMIRHQMSFLDPALLPSRQIVTWPRCRFILPKAASCDTSA